MSYTKTPHTPRKPNVIRAVADVPAIIARLLGRNGETLAAIAREYGVEINSLQPHVVKAMTRQQHATWHQRCSHRHGMRRWVPIGTVKTHRGRRWIKIADEPYQTGHNWIALARWKWEFLNGPLAGLVLWFKDGDAMHDDVENLEAITRAEKVSRFRKRPGWEQKRVAKLVVAKQRNSLDRLKIRRAQRATKRNRGHKVSRRQQVQPIDAKARGKANITAFLASLEAA